MSSDNIESPSGIDHSIAANAEAIADIIPATLQLVKVLHVPHALHTVRSAVAYRWHIRMVDDHIGGGTLEVLHGFGKAGAPVGTGDESSGGHSISDIRLLHVLAIA